MTRRASLRMTDAMFGSIWKIMSEYKFVYEGVEDLACTICNEVMTDACQSHCGCQFCYKCIHALIADEFTYCPGNKEYCKDVYLTLDINVFRNAMLNRKISALKVNCPNQSCGSTVQLNEMFDHLRLCTKQPMECPYAVLGCTPERSIKDTIVTHLHTDVLRHTELLLGLVQNMKNEINVLKDDSDKSKSEMATLRNELMELRNEVDIKVNEATEEIKRNMNDQFEEIVRLRTTVDDLTKEMKDNFVKNEVDMKLLQEDSQNKQNKIGLLEKEITDIKNELEIENKAEMEKINKCLEEQMDNIQDIRIKGENNGEMVVQVKNNFNKMVEDRKAYSDDREKRMIFYIKWNEFCPNTDVDFAWRVDNCSKKINKNMLSQSFYSNNYRFCLCMRIYDYGYIGIWCIIMKGDSDDRVEWPMLRAVTLNIIDGDTLEVDKSETYKYDTYERDRSAFDRPKNEKNPSWIGKDSFVKYSKIKNRNSIIDDEPIYLSCKISDSR